MSIFKKVIKREYHMLAIVTAAFLVLVLDLVHVIPEKFVISIILVLLAALVLFMVINTTESEETFEKTAQEIHEISEKLKKQELTLIKPPNLFSHNEELSKKCKDDVWFFNMCMNMFRSKEVSEQFLQPYLLNKKINKLSFVIKPEDKELWEKEVFPNFSQLKNSFKIQAPQLRNIDENIAFVMVSLDTPANKEEKEALLAIWGEPFMVYYPVSDAKHAFVPRCYIHIDKSSDLIHRLKDIWDKYKFKK